MNITNEVMSQINDGGINIRAESTTSRIFETQTATYEYCGHIVYFENSVNILSHGSLKSTKREYNTISNIINSTNFDVLNEYLEVMFDNNMMTNVNLTSMAGVKLFNMMRHWDMDVIMDVQKSFFEIRENRNIPKVKKAIDNIKLSEYYEYNNKGIKLKCLTPVANDIVISVFGAQFKARLGDADIRNQSIVINAMIDLGVYDDFMGKLRMHNIGNM